MTAPPAFPSLPGLGWSVHKTPTFSTRVASHVSGREVRDANYAYPLWTFALTFEGLASSAAFPGLGANSLQSLMGLFLQCQGQFGTFLFTDPTDYAVTAQPIGTGDGSTTDFTLQRSFGGFTEPVGWVLAIGAVTVGGSVVAAGRYSLTTPNTLVFTTAPATGAAIAASFTFAFQCRFADDAVDFEQIMANLWTVQSLKFVSVRSV